MKIDRITMRGFTVHRSTDLVLPSTGIVTVVGPNGSGKSSLVEAPSYAVWGKTLRGAYPWPDDSVGGGVGVVVSNSVASQLDVLRELRGSPGIQVGSPRGGVHLGWAAGALSSANFDTNTKAQAALERIVGSWDVWRRTHVFSSQDAAHFSTATDKERKLLLERLIGLERFDGALERCRASIRTQEGEVQQAERDVSVLTERLAGARAATRDAALRLAAAETAPEPVEPVGDPVAIEAEVRHVEAQIKAADADARAARDNAQEALSGSAGKGGELRALQTRLSLLVDRAECPTCEQPVPPAKVADLRQAVWLEVQAQREAEAAAREAGQRARAEAAEFDAECQALRARAQALRSRASVLRAEVAAYGRALAVFKGAKENARALHVIAAGNEADQEKRLENAETVLGLKRGVYSVLRGAEQVLGMRGVRAHVLGQALEGIAASASVWLTRLSYDLMVLRLSAYTERKSGDGLLDAISVKVGHRSDPDLREYDSLSGGERRRVDVSLLLALAEVAAHAHATTPGTMFFDEVFDALDADGIAAVSEALSDLASTRCVVVISHSKALVDMLPATVALVAESGTLRRDSR